MKYLNALLFSVSSGGSSTIYRSNSSTWALSRRLKIENFNITFQDWFLSILHTIYSHMIYIDYQSSTCVKFGSRKHVTCSNEYMKKIEIVQNGTKASWKWQGKDELQINEATIQSFAFLDYFFFIQKLFQSEIFLI